MAAEVYMDIPAVTNIANSFGTFGDVLQKVSQGLQAAIVVLQVTAFMGLVGGEAVVAYAEQVKPNVDNLAKKMLALQQDIQGAISNYQTGDQSGSSRFR